MICLILKAARSGDGSLKICKARPSKICYHNCESGFWRPQLASGFFSDMIMDESEIAEKIQQLIVQHRDLDVEIVALIESGKSDVIHIQRLKKQKLYLRDRIARMENDLLPDIIA